MKLSGKVTMLLVAFAAFMVSPKAARVQSGHYEVAENSTLSFARRAQADTNSTFEALASKEATPVFQTDNFSSYYFKNLNTNFGNNVHGTCSYVSIGMILSFYDSYWSDSFISEIYESIAVFPSDRQFQADFDLIPSTVDSPGVLSEPSSIVGDLTIEEYSQAVSAYSGTYFQFKLMDIAMSLFGAAKFDGSDSSLGMTREEIVSLLDKYLNDHTALPKSSVSIKTFSDASEAAIKKEIVRNVRNGVPVLLRAKKTDSDAGHAMVAYDYDDENGEIYVHTGWRDDSSHVSLTHVALSDLPYNELLDLTYLEIGASFDHSHSFNYRAAGGDALCACSYIYPREIQLTSGNFADSLPTYEWMSLHKEKWFPGKDIAFEFSLLDGNEKTETSKNRIHGNAYSFSQAEWDLVRFSISGETYKVLIVIDEQSDLFGSDDFWCKQSFKKPFEYETVPYIKPSEYGFADAYPSDEMTANQFINHTSRNGGSFQTRRYRTGYIHNEYVVMSPIRRGFNHAFIEYRFNTAITRIDVQLSHWREYSKERLDKNSGRAEIQTFLNDEWVCKLDLLDDATNLPRNRNKPNTYKVVFDRPVYNIRFYCETYTTPKNDSNSGRICIGGLAFYEYEGLPLSGYELKYDTSIWQGKTMINNCYAYALNNQVVPGTNDVWYKQQPGAYSKSVQSPFTKDVLKAAVANDFTLYNKNFGTKLIFEEVDKYDIVPEGTYKVALVSYSSDYHWYRQDADGYWSHKPGVTPVRRIDNSGHFILDPETCDRGPYVNFLGFYAVTPWNNLYKA